MLIPLDFLKAECTLSWEGVHGFRHWQRVRNNGLRLANFTGASIEIVELFSVLHDLKRLNDDYDPDHGKRAAEFIRTIQGNRIFLAEDDLEMLCYACEFHTAGLTEADFTVQTCWDADRLDLGRVGIRPDKDRLCTDAAKDPSVMNWAYEMSRAFS